MKRTEISTRPGTVAPVSLTDKIFGLSQANLQTDECNNSSGMSQSQRGVDLI
jgi:hypothetical protein